MMLTAKRQRAYEKAEAMRQSEIREAKNFKDLLDNHLELGLSATIFTDGKVGVHVRQRDDRMSRSMERKHWNIFASDLRKMNEKEIRSLVLSMERA